MEISTTIFQIRPVVIVFILMTLRITESNDTEHDTDLISEQQLCPRLQSAQFISEYLSFRRSFFESVIILADLTSSSMKCEGQSCPLPPCKFMVRTTKYNYPNPVDKSRPHPSKGELIGAFRSRFKWFPIAKSKAISDLGFSDCWKNFIEFQPKNFKGVLSPEAICQIPAMINPLTPTELASLPTDRGHKAQAILWNVRIKSTFSNLLALMFNHEFNATATPTQANDGNSQKKNPGFIHLIFMFNSSEGGCYIRLEHYEIFPKNTNNCSTTPTECNLLSCAKLHLLESKIKNFYRWEKQLDTANPFDEDDVDGPRWYKMDTWNSSNKSNNYYSGHSHRTITPRKFPSRIQDPSNPIPKVIIVCSIFIAVLFSGCWKSSGSRSEDEETNADEERNLMLTSPASLRVDAPPGYDSVNFNLDQLPSYVEAVRLKKSPVHSSVKFNVDRSPSLVEAMMRLKK